MLARLLAIAWCAALLAAACSSADDPAGTTLPAARGSIAPTTTAIPPPIEEPAPPAVEIRNGVVHPSTLDLVSRDTGVVVFVNEDDEERIVASRDDEFAPFPVPPGGSVEFDFSTLPTGVHRFFVQVGNARNPGLVDTSGLGETPASELVRSWDGRVGFEAVTDIGDWEFLGLARGIIGGERTGWLALQSGLRTGERIADVESSLSGLVVTWEDGGSDPAAAGEARLAQDELPEGCDPGEARDAAIGSLTGREEEHVCGIATLLRGFVADPAGPVVHYRMLAFDRDDRLVMQEARATLHLDPGTAPVTPPETQSDLFGHPLLLKVVGGGPDDAHHFNADIRLALADGWLFHHHPIGPWHSGQVTIVNEDGVAYELHSPAGPAGTVPAGGELTLEVGGDGWYTLVGDDLGLVPLYLDTRGRDATGRLVEADSGDGVTLLHLEEPGFGPPTGTPSRWTWDDDRGGIEGSPAVGRVLVDPFGPEGPGPPLFAVDVVDTGAALTAEEGQALIDAALDNARQTAPCPPADRVAVSYGGWAGEEAGFDCPAGELRIGVLHEGGTSTAVVYVAVTETDEDRWHVATALDTMDIDP